MLVLGVREELPGTLMVLCREDEKCDLLGRKAKLADYAPLALPLESVGNALVAGSSTAVLPANGEFSGSPRGRRSARPAWNRTRLRVANRSDSSCPARWPGARTPVAVCSSVAL